MLEGKPEEKKSPHSNRINIKSRICRCCVAAGQEGASAEPFSTTDGAALSQHNSVRKQDAYACLWTFRQTALATPPPLRKSSVFTELNLIC